MTIALFSDSYLPVKSGVVTVVIQLREQLLQQGHRVLLVTVATTDEFSKEEKDIYKVPSKPLGLGTDQFISVPFLPPIVKFIKDSKVDLIHCHTEFGIGQAGIHCAKKLRIPAICTTHTMWTDFYKHYIPLGRFIPPRMIQLILNSYYKRFDCLIGVSTKARNYFKQKGMLPNTPSVIVPNAIDQQKFMQRHISDRERKKIRRSFGIRDKDIVILFLGRVAEEKRIFELVNLLQNVVARAPNCKAMIVGNGPAFSDITQFAADEIASGKIIFTGFVEWTKVHSFYESADIFVTASLSEMHSMTILEAELSGLPIVTRNDESYLDSVFDGENGYLCNNEDEMEDRLLELIVNHDKRKSFGAKSLQTTTLFSIENHIKRTLMVYDAVIKAYPRKINDIDVAHKIAKEILANGNNRKSL